MSTPKYQIALAGNPNVGKSSVFNLLTGLQQKVGNFPGVTVDRKSGNIELEKCGSVEITDLPGLYSLFPVSEDERVVVNILLKDITEKPLDAIGYIADANDLERNLLLFTQIRDLGYPMVLGINMLDTAKDNRIEIDLQGLSKDLGVPVVPVSGRSGHGMDAFKKALELVISTEKVPVFYQLNEDESLIAKDVQSFVGASSLYQALLLTHHYKHIRHLSALQKEYIEKLVEKYLFNSLDEQLDEMMQRFQLITPIIQKNVIKHSAELNPLTKKIDKILTHPIVGLAIFLGLMLVIFQSIFTWSEKPMTWVEESFAWMGDLIAGIVPDGWFQDLLIEGVISGLAGVLVFVPQIAILFFLISLLEESGYMARVVYLMDSFMRKFGLNGRSVVSLISGGACAIPAVMSTRTINNWKERLITIMVTPLISCSARIPVFTILIAVAVPPEKIAGWISLQAVVFMGLYVLGAITALLIAWCFHKILKTDEQSFLVMELPRYQMPHWRNVFLNVWEKVKTFSWEAGKVILVVSIILWVLASYGPSKAMQEAEELAEKEYAVSQEIPLEQLVTTHQLESSYAGIIGKTIEPLIKPLGYDWKIGIALLSSFAAREVFVGTMATLYAVEDEENEALLRERLQNATFRETGEKVFTLGTAISLMIFYLFAMQCISTVAIVKRETKSWKWPAIQVAYMGVLAYMGSWIATLIF